MALSTQNVLLAKRRALNYSLQPKSRLLVDSLFKYLAQFNQSGPGGPDLQIVEFDVLSSTTVVIADAACKIYAIVLVKVTATAAFFKLTDHATTASDDSSEIVQKIAGAKNEVVLLYPDGFTLANGAVVECDTTASGATGSGANGARGFIILGS